MMDEVSAWIEEMLSCADWLDGRDDPRAWEKMLAALDELVLHLDDEISAIFVADFTYWLAKAVHNGRVSPYDADLLRVHVAHWVDLEPDGVLEVARNVLELRLSAKKEKKGWR